MFTLFIKRLVEGACYAMTILTAAIGPPHPITVFPVSSFVSSTAVLPNTGVFRNITPAVSEGLLRSSVCVGFLS